MYRLKQIILTLGDSLVYVGALLLSVLVRLRSNVVQEFFILLPHFIALFVPIVLINFITGLYDLGQFRQPALTKKIILAGCSAFLLGISYFYLYPTQSVAPKTILVFALVFSFGLFYLWRLLYRRFISATLGQLNMLFIGHDEALNELAKKITHNPALGYSIIGWIGQNNSSSQHDEISALITAKKIPDIVVIAPSAERDTTLINNLYAQVIVIFLQNLCRTRKRIMMTLLLCLMLLKSVVL
jgi:hypothetical protein